MLLSDVGRMRIFLSALSRYTHIEDLDFGYYPEDDRPYHAALEPFLFFFFRSPELFTSLDKLAFGIVKDKEPAAQGQEQEEDGDDGEDEHGKQNEEPLMMELLERAVKDEKSCFAAKTIEFDQGMIFPFSE